METGWRSLSWKCDFSPPSESLRSHSTSTSLSLRTNSVAIRWHGCTPQNKAVAGTDQQRPRRVWHGRHTPIREQPGAYDTRAGEDMSVPSAVLVDEFCVEEFSSKTGLFGAETLFQFWILFFSIIIYLILAALHPYLISSSVCSQILNRIFSGFLSTHFLSPLNLLLLQLLLFLHLLHTSQPISFTGVLGARQGPRDAVLTLGSHARVFSLLKNPMRAPTTLAGAPAAQTSISREAGCQILADLPGRTQLFNCLSPCSAGAALDRDGKRANSR